MGLLEGIQRGYRGMHSAAVEVVEMHPGNVAGVIHTLKERLCSSLDLRPR